MNADISFEAAAYVMLLITQIFYYYKNWIDVRKNRIYLELLNWTMAGITIDLLSNVLYVVMPAYKEIVSSISGIFMSVLMMGIFFQFYVYNISFTQITKKFIKVEMVIMNIMILAGCFFSIVSPVIGYDMLYRYYLAEMYGRGSLFQSVICFICLFAGIVHILIHRKKLSSRELVLLLISDCAIAVNIVVERKHHTENLAEYYLIAMVLVAYYMVLHNMDRYRFLASGCFARVGFYTVLEEREIYKENFYCLGVSVTNYESITNYCTESEIEQVQHMIGSVLRRICGRHHVYHAHSFEYMVLYNQDGQVERAHRQLLKEMPDYFRINDKNVSVSMDYYAVEFADADYKINNFYSVITSMKKLSEKQANKEKLMYYQGSRQRDIEKNLEAMRVVNHAITKRKFLLKESPIRAKDDTEKFFLEISAYVKLEDGECVAQEEVWKLAEKMGLQRELGITVLEQACAFIAEQELVTSEIKKAHINMVSADLESVESAKEYVAILKKYHIPGRFICFEVNLNQNSDYSALEKVFGLLRGYGVSFLLDQFGVSVVSLKSVINMPFDSVKLNRRITQAYCGESSSQLTYLLDMLNARDWKVVVDGVDEEEWLLKLADLKYQFVQGAYISRLFEKKQSDKESGKKMGGVFVG